MIADREDGFKISLLKDDIDIDKLHSFLSKDAYWSLNIPEYILSNALENSICFSLLSPNNEFVGFARTITDQATFAYLADVYIDTNFRKEGLGKWLIENVMNYDGHKDIRTWVLFTKDAHGLYEKFGWEKMEDCEKLMVIRSKSNYYLSDQFR